MNVRLELYMHKWMFQEIEFSVIDRGHDESFQNACERKELAINTQIGELFSIYARQIAKGIPIWIQVCLTSRSDDINSSVTKSKALNNPLTEDQCQKKPDRTMP